MMANSNSSLVTDILLLTKHYTKQNSKNVKKFTPHHAAGVTTVKGMYNVFCNKTASANYGLSKGRIALYVNEKDRAWTSCSGANDGQAITVEVANCKGAPYWEVADEDVKNLILLGVDVCKRNGLKGFTWTGNSSGTLTVHRMFSSTVCPGPYLYTLMPWIAQEITARVNGLKSGEIVIPKVSFASGTKTTTTKSNPATSTPTVNYTYNGVDLSPVFDYRYYADKYADLKKAFGYNETNLFMHFCSNGMKEGRQATSTFNPVNYRNNNPDVSLKYGNNWVGYYAHYCIFGIKEGRNGI